MKLYEVGEKGFNRAGQVVTLLRTVMKLRIIDLDLDPAPVKIAKTLVQKRAPGEFLRQLVMRHQMAKPDGPWIILDGDRVRVLAPSKSLNFKVAPRSYRLDAFDQILRDLKMLQ